MARLIAIEGVGRKRRVKGAEIGSFIEELGQSYSVRKGRECINVEKGVETSQKEKQYEQKQENELAHEETGDWPHWSEQLMIKLIWDTKLQICASKLNKAEFYQRTSSRGYIFFIVIYYDIYDNIYFNRFLI